MIRTTFRSIRYTAFAAIAASCSWCLAGPPVTVGRAVPPGEQVALGRISHAVWDALLNKYVDGQGYVDYAKWKASASDQKALDDYLAQLSGSTLTTP
jgi:hypothetical protein